METKGGGTAVGEWCCGGGGGGLVSVDLDQEGLWEKKKMIIVVSVLVSWW